MRALPGYVYWLIAVAATLSFLAPALEIAAPPLLPAQHWNGVTLTRSGVAALSGRPIEGDPYRESAVRLTFEREIFHPERVPGGAAAAAPPLTMVQVSGLFRIARYIPVELVFVAIALLGVLATLAFRGFAWMRLLAGMGAACAGIAIALFMFLASATHGQWEILSARLPAGTLTPWGAGAGLRVEWGLYAATFCLLFLCLAPIPAETE